MRIPPIQIAGKFLRADPRMSALSNLRIRNTYSRLASKRRWLRDQIQQRAVSTRRRRIGFEQLEIRALLATITVTGLLDNIDSDGIVTLREALQAAETDTSVDGSTAGSGADTIEFSPALTETGGATILLGGTEFAITTPIAIRGPGANLLTIDAQDSSRIFHVDDGNSAGAIDVEIAGMTLTGGLATDGSPSASESDYGGAILSRENLTLTGSTVSGNSAIFGGGLFNRGGTLTVIDSEISGNSATFDGGGLWNYSGSLTVSGSTVTGNSAIRDGGGLFNREGGTLTVAGSTITGNAADRYGGGLRNRSGMLTVSGSTIAGNTARFGGGLFNGGAAATMTVTDSSITGNSALFDGGGSWNYVGAMTVTGSTFSGNEANRDGGGLFNRGSGTLTVASSTIVDNRGDANGNGSGSGGGIRTVNEGTTATQLMNTIVAGNVTGTGAETASDLFGRDVESGSAHNLIGDAGSAGGLTDGTNNNLVGVDPLLGALAHNGGPTLTHARTSRQPGDQCGEQQRTQRSARRSVPAR